MGREQRWPKCLRHGSRVLRRLPDDVVSVLIQASERTPSADTSVDIGTSVRVMIRMLSPAIALFPGSVLPYDAAQLEQFGVVFRALGRYYLVPPYVTRKLREIYPERFREASAASPPSARSEGRSPVAT